MIEVRQIQEDEVAGFLELLCEVFGLDHGRASTVFYSEPFYDLRRKWALFADGQMASILTTTPLDYGFGKAIGIAGVGTLEIHRNKGYGEKLLQIVLDDATANGEPHAILFAHQEVLYKRCGFETVDHVIRASINQTCQLPYTGMIPEAQVEQMYAEWAKQNPLRLNRDERRWRYWRYVFRETYPAPGGYVASETNLCREAIFNEPIDVWPLLPSAEWYGLRSMTKLLGVPTKDEREELLLMTRNFPDIPQMFMSDQF
ncbi:MAG: GNAT family N-acetyltransferase [Fimbriimonadaceae bacterium]